jgi:predicted CXXCH cytochrome family protein
MADYFAASPHAPIFTKLGVPGCVGCHGNHAVTAAADTMLGVAAGTVCGRCHVAGAGGGITAAAMRSAIDSLREDFATADSLLATAEHAGMEVSQPQFDLRSARTSLLQARNAIHTFVTDSVSRHVDEGLVITATAIKRGHAALHDLRFRRVGLGVSTGIIVLLITGLVLKIRQLEGRAG